MNSFRVLEISMLGIKSIFFSEVICFLQIAVLAKGQKTQTTSSVNKINRQHLVSQKNETVAGPINAMHWTARFLTFSQTFVSPLSHLRGHKLILACQVNSETQHQ